LYCKVAYRKRIFDFFFVRLFVHLFVHPFAVKPQKPFEKRLGGEASTGAQKGFFSRMAEICH
jgi:hypothetical protein